MSKKVNNQDLKIKLTKVIEDARAKQAEKNEDGSKKYNAYEILSSIDVNDFVSTNFQKLSYLSWADALHIAKHLYPDIIYSVCEFDTFIEDKNGNLHPTKLPYLYDPILGYLVKVTVTIEEKAQVCLLPVFDGNHLAKKSVEYGNSKKKNGNVEVANMGDINYAHQRALVKCLALHGLGDYLYRGESLPSGTAEVEPELLDGQYISEEIEALRNAIYKAKESNPQIKSIPPSKANSDLFKNGGDNTGYVNELMAMARQYGINPMEYIKTLPKNKEK
jgi:hypothetical protein